MFLEIFVILMAIPIGILIRKVCSDELKMGRKWIYWLFLISFSFMILSFAYFERYISYTLLFIAIVSLISLIKK
jgi:hypothetical protein